MKMEMPARLQKKVKRYGSVLKAYRKQDSLGTVLLLILGIYVMAFMGMLTPFALFFEPEDAAIWLIMDAVFAGIGLIMLLIRALVRAGRARNYLSYYQKQTGYSEKELQEADRELMGHSAVKLGEVPQVLSRKPALMYIVTGHYILAVSQRNGCYLRKLDDIVAAFHSCQIPQGVFAMRHEGLFLISRQDIDRKPKKNRITKKWYGGFDGGPAALAGSWDRFCAEILEEIGKRMPRFIPFQNIVVNGIRYDLLSLQNWREDWNRILHG